MPDKYNIAIISNLSLRAETLSKIIEEEFNNTFEVPVFETNKLDALENLLKPLLLIIDLMGTDQMSRQVLDPIKKMDSEIKIIALHLYRSNNLVNPLFRIGIDGYIYYEPSKKELITAIRTVLSGKKYIPHYLISA